MSRLEERYRRMLKVLPASYRRTWEDDMVSTFLESAGAEEDGEDAAYLRDYGWPDRSEVLSVLALATRLRFGGVGAEPVSRLWGDAIRAVALVGLLFHAVTATMGIGIMLWLAGEFGSLPAPPTEAAFSLPGEAGRLALDFVGLCGIAAFLALTVNQPRPARWLAVVPLGTAWIATTYEAVSWPGGVPASSWLTLLVDTGLVLALLAFHREAPPVHTRRWLAAFAVGVSLSPLYAVAMWALPVEQDLRFAALDWPGLCSLSAAVAGIGYLILRRSAVAQAAYWPLTLLLLGLAALALRGVSVADYAAQGSTSVGTAAIAFCSAEAAVLFLVCVPLAMLARRAVRELRVAPLDVSG